MDQRLGGARPIDPTSIRCPPGFQATAVAAGFTSPCAVTGDDDGFLHVVERGHPSRTPPRVYRVDAATGVASLIAELPRGGKAIVAPIVPPFGGAYVDAEGALYVCDPGPCLPSGTGAAPGAEALHAPGAGVIWRVAPVEVRSGSARASSTRARLRLGTHGTYQKGALVAGGIAVLAAALALTAFYRRGRRATVPAADRYRR